MAKAYLDIKLPQVSLAATVATAAIDTQGMEAVSWELATTGTPTGTLTVEGSNQYDPLLNPNAVFVAQPATVPALPVPAGAGQTALVSTPAGGAGGGGRYQRIRYARTSGSGTLDVWVHASGAA